MISIVEVMVCLPTEADPEQVNTSNLNHLGRSHQSAQCVSLVSLWPAGVTAPHLTGLTGTELSNWGCSIHEFFELTYPPAFQVNRDCLSFHDMLCHMSSHKNLMG